MRTINFGTWPRREHFELYSSFDHPHFGLCANVDITEFYPFVKERKISITIAIVYLISRSANAIPEFRQRIRNECVVEHEIVHPSGTILSDINDLFSFCHFDYHQDFERFTAVAKQRIAYYRKHPTLRDGPGRDDLLFMTAIPWVSFTGFMHPMNLQPADSVPRFAWGKFFKEGDRLNMPLGVQVHHALMDGIHVGRYYQIIQDYFDRPGAALNSVSGLY